MLSKKKKPAQNYSHRTLSIYIKLKTDQTFRKEVESNGGRGSCLRGRHEEGLWGAGNVQLLDLVVDSIGEFISW